MSKRRFGPPPPKPGPPGKFRLTLLVFLGSLPIFIIFQNFGRYPETFKFNLPTASDKIEAPSDLMTSDGTHLSLEIRPLLRQEITNKAWQIQAAEENRRALRLLAAQISESFPEGQLSAEIVFKSFSTKDFQQQTLATQMVAGDAVPVCQWLQVGYGSFFKRSSESKRCKNQNIDLETETNLDCRFQAMIEKCDLVPPLPYPSLFESWRLCGEPSCETQISKDLATYFKFYLSTGDERWLMTRFVPMASQALKQTEGDFVLLPHMEFAQHVLSNSELSKLKTAEGITLEQKALEYVMAFDRAWGTEFRGIANLKSELYRPTTANVSRFHALLKRSEIQRKMADPAAQENARIVREFARRLKSEVFAKKNLNLGYTPEVFEFISDAAANDLEFSQHEVGTLKSTLTRHLRASPWSTQPRSFGLLLSTFSASK